MTPRAHCPAEDVWLSLLQGPVDAQLEARLSQHLENCECCRQRLDRLSGASDWLPDVAGWLCETPEADSPGLQLALTQLTRESVAAMIAQPVSTRPDVMIITDRPSLDVTTMRRGRIWRQRILAARPLIVTGLLTAALSSRWLQPSDPPPVESSSGAGPAASAKSQRPQFEIRSSVEEPTLTCDSLAAAVALAREGDTVLIHAVEPIDVPPLTIVQAELTLQAAPGSTVILQPAGPPKSTSPSAWLTVRGHLRLQGLELRESNLGEPSARPLLSLTEGVLELTGCTLRSRLIEAAALLRADGGRVVLDNSDCHSGAGVCLDWMESPRGELQLTSSLLAGGCGLRLTLQQPSSGTFVKLQRVTAVTRELLQLDLSEGTPGTFVKPVPLTIETERSTLRTFESVVTAILPHDASGTSAVPAQKTTAVLRAHLNWSDSGSVWDVTGDWLRFEGYSNLLPHLVPRSHADWQSFWNRNTSASRAERLRFPTSDVTAQSIVERVDQLRAELTPQ
ncbi:hypothetical protein GC176_13925 [bacterium]|nr:hypothetical protein [bacterium]